jgi:hypothetical protein
MAMPKSRFHEVYPGLCGARLCCLRRSPGEVFAFLPVESLIITASADWLDPPTGRTLEQPVLSVGMHRGSLEGLDFEWLDPSDAIEGFFITVDFKASRKLGIFQPISR